MMDEKTGLAAALAAVLGPLGVIIARWWERRSAKEQQQGDWRERGTNTLFDRQSAELARAYTRHRELEAEIARLEADRDKVLEIGRAWHDKAHDMRHDHINTLQLALARGTPEQLLLRSPGPLPPFLQINHRPSHEDTAGSG